MRKLILLIALSFSPTWAASGGQPHSKPRPRPRPNQERFAKLYRSIVTLKVALSDQNVRVVEFQKMATDAKVEAAVSEELASSEIEREFVARATAAAKGAEEVGHAMGQGGTGLMASSLILLKDDIAAAIAIYRGEAVPQGHSAEAAGAFYDSLKSLAGAAPPTPPPPSQTGEDRAHALDPSSSPFPLARVTEDRMLVRSCEKIDDLEVSGGNNEDGTYVCHGKWIKYFDRNSHSSLMGGCLGANFVLVTAREEDRLTGVAYRCQQPAEKP